MVGLGLGHLVAREPEQERRGGGREVDPVEALEPDGLRVVIDPLDEPPRLPGRPVAALPD